MARWFVVAVAVVAALAVGCAPSSPRHADRDATTIAIDDAGSTRPDDANSTRPDGGPRAADAGVWWATPDLPDGYGVVMNVQLSVHASGNLVAPLSICLREQALMALRAPDDHVMYPWSPDGGYYLMMSPERRTSPEFNAYARGRAVYALQQQVLLEPGEGKGEGLYEHVRYIYLALSSVDPSGWTDVFEPGITYRAAGYATPRMADVGILWLEEPDGRVLLVYVDVAPCAPHFFQSVEWPGG